MRIGQKLNIPLLIISVGNLINGLKRNEGLYYYIWYVGIFVLLIPIMHLIPEKKDKKIVSTILLLLSCLGIFIGGDFNLVSVTFFCFSIAILEPNKQTYIIYSIIMSIILIAKLTFTDINVSQFSVTIAGSSSVIIIYQHYIHPKVKQENEPNELLKLYKPMEVKNDIVDIIQMKVLGYDWPEINVKLELNIKDSEVSRKVRNERNRLGFVNQDQFNFWLFKNGIISPISDNIEILD